MLLMTGARSSVSKLLEVGVRADAGDDPPVARPQTHNFGGE